MFRLFAILLSAVVCCAQVPDGTVFAVRLKQKLSSKDAKVGAVVRFETVSAVVVHGQVAIPQTVKILGRVFDAARFEGSSARLGIRIERAEWKGGAQELRAYFLRPLVEQYYVNVRCLSALPPVTHGFLQERGNSPQSPTTGAAPMPQRPTPSAPTVGPCTERRRIETPRLKNVELGSLKDGKTVLVSRRGEIVLKPGMLFEVKQTDAP